MTAKEKAKEIFMDMKYHIPYVHDPTEPSEDKIAKECALIAVEEMLGEYQSMSDLESIIVINDEVKFVVHQLVYWMEVKQEIQNL